MDKLNEILQKRFGHATFRAGQQEIIEQIIEKKMLSQYFLQEWGNHFSTNYLLI